MEQKNLHNCVIRVKYKSTAAEQACSHRIVEYLRLEGTHEDHRVQLLSGPTNVLYLFKERWSLHLRALSRSRSGQQHLFHCWVPSVFISSWLPAKIKFKVESCMLSYQNMSWLCRTLCTVQVCRGGSSFFLGVLRQFACVSGSCKACLALPLPLTGSANSDVPTTGANLLTAPANPFALKTSSLGSGCKIDFLMADLQSLHDLKLLNLNLALFRHSFLVCIRHQALSSLALWCRGTAVILLLGWGVHLGTTVSDHPSKAQSRGKYTQCHAAPTRHLLSQTTWNPWKKRIGSCRFWNRPI